MLADRFALSALSLVCAFALFGCEEKTKDEELEEVLEEEYQDPPDDQPPVLCDDQCNSVEAMILVAGCEHVCGSLDDVSVAAGASIFALAGAAASVGSDSACYVALSECELTFCEGAYFDCVNANSPEYCYGEIYSPCLVEEECQLSKDACYTVAQSTEEIGECDCLYDACVGKTTPESCFEEEEEDEEGNDADDESDQANSSRAARPQPNGPGRWNVSRRWIEHQLGRLPALAAESGLARARDPESGERFGFRLLTLDSNDTLHQLGLRRGDVLSSVNGIALRDASAALRAYESLSRASEIRLNVERAGRPLALRYRILP